MKEPDTDFSEFLNEGRKGLREVQQSVQRLGNHLKLLVPEEEEIVHNRDAINENKSDLHCRDPMIMQAKLLHRAIAAEETIREKIITKAQRQLDDWDRLSEDKINRTGTILLSGSTSEVKHNAYNPKLAEWQKQWVKILVVQKFINQVRGQRKGARLEHLERCQKARVIQRNCRQRFRLGTRSEARGRIRRWIAKTIFSRKLNTMREDGTNCLISFLRDVKESRGICVYIQS